MSQRILIERRQFLTGSSAAAASLTLARPSTVFAQGAQFKVKIGSNQAIENSAMQQLIVDRGYFKDLSLDASVVESKTVDGPMNALLSGDGDICMISGFVGVLPAIEHGKELRLIGAAMLLPALAVYSKDPSIKQVSDLVGKNVGVGPKNGLLHILMIALLRKKNIDPAKVNFVPSGSNAQVFEAVIAGKVDAGLSGTAGMSNPAAHTLTDGLLWEQVPEYTYQPAYASVKAIKEKPEALSRCLAAYTKLYRFLSQPDSKAAYLDARKRAGNEPSSAEGEAVWNFIQKVKPYAVNVGLTPERVAYLQQLNVAVGTQTKVLPFEQVADNSIAEGAKRFLS